MLHFIVESALHALNLHRLPRPTMSAVLEALSPIDSCTRAKRQEMIKFLEAQTPDWNRGLLKIIDELPSRGIRDPESRTAQENYRDFVKFVVSIEKLRSLQALFHGHNFTVAQELVSGCEAVLSQQEFINAVDRIVNRSQSDGYDWYHPLNAHFRQIPFNDENLMESLSDK